MTRGARRPVLWIVTQAYRREALTRVCFEQRARLLDELAGRGVDAHQVVVSDDGNVATAREFGFEVLERPNVLGRRVNDGLEWACREGGADFAIYVGSDDWMLSEWLADVPAPGRVRASGRNAWVAPEAARLVAVPTPPPLGNAPWIVSRAALERCGFRPARDELRSDIDSAMVDALGHAAFDYRRDDHPLRWVGFKGSAEQVTRWPIQAPVGRRYDRGRGRGVWETLATCYPPDLVERMEKFYAEGMPE